MILTIDIGNTNINIGGFESDVLVFTSSISTDVMKTEDEYAILISQTLFLHNIKKEEICGAIISSVVPPVNLTIKKAVEFLFSTNIVFVQPGIKSGIGIHCDIPSSVGADLIAASVAAHYIYGSPSLIVDLGTATKMTVVNSAGIFIGTSIIPGVQMGLNALSESTAQLPKISLEKPNSIIAKNTTECMRSGVVFGHACLIDGMIDRINEEFGEKLSVYATGGFAESIIPYCKHQIKIDKHLVLKGLNLLYKKNQPKTKQ